jgi:hypothetical protein
MLRLSEVKTLIIKPEFTLTKQINFDMVNKYFFDFDEKQKDKLSKMAIELWDKKKTKITNPQDLQLLSYYLDTNFGYQNISEDNDSDEIEDTDNIKHIVVARKYKFNYSVYEDDDIRQENIFKLNFYNIVEKLKFYFPNVDINIFFEKSTYVDREIKKANTTYKHDVVINIKKKSDNEEEDSNYSDEYDIDNTYEIVLEYFEKIHNRFNDEDKKISTNLFSDEYLVYNVNTDNMEDFIIDSIYTIIQIICVAINDEYELSKILYFDKNNKKKNNRDYAYFNKIVTIQKNKEFNLKEFHKNIRPCDPETNDDMTFDDFIDYIENELEIEIKYIDKKFNCSSELFDNLILLLPISVDETDILKEYKNKYSDAMKALLTASKKIIEILRKQRTKRMQLPLFIKNFQKFHKDNLKL